MSFRFRNLRVYQEATILHRSMVVLTKKFSGEFEYLRNQLRRAPLSIVLNIAEGSAKNSDKDFNRYRSIASGSINESMAGCEVALAETLILQQEFKNIEHAAENLTNQLGSFSC